MEYDFPVHSTDPKQLDRFRDRFSPAGAKDDSRDAEALTSALRTDRAASAAWSRSTRSSSTSGNSRGLPKISLTPATGSVTASVSSWGATIRRC